MRLTKERLDDLRVTYRGNVCGYTKGEPPEGDARIRVGELIDTIDALEAELAAANATLTRLEVVMQRLRGIPAKDGKVGDVPSQVNSTMDRYHQLEKEQSTDALKFPKERQ